MNAKSEFCPSLVDIDNRHMAKAACEPGFIKYVHHHGTDEVSRYHLVHVGMSFENDRITDNELWYRSKERDWDYRGPQNHLPGAYWEHTEWSIRYLLDDTFTSICPTNAMVSFSDKKIREEDFKHE